MDDEEVVETSDSEEREAIRASYPDYWLHNTYPLSSASTLAHHSRFLVPESGLDVLDNSQDELLLSTQPKSPTNGNRVQPSPSDSHRRESPSFADQPVPNVRSRSGSVDPLSLFSSMPTTPPFSSIKKSNLFPDESVPCPPISSNISSTTSVRDQTPSPPPQSFPNDPHPIPQDLQDAEVIRYSLRTRQPKQVKPYAYDRVAYKQQMKSNPDAIVKFQSLRRGSRGVKEMEEDWAMDLENMDQDEIWEERWRRKERSLDSVDDENNGRVGKWYPKSLGDDLSSDEDKEVRELRKEVKNARKKREIEEMTREDKDNRRRKQQFPVSTIQSEDHTLRETPKTKDRRSRSTVCLIRYLHLPNQSCGYSGKHSLD
jgi:hypothetical protein